jgi:hypothetical protein
MSKRKDDWESGIGWSLGKETGYRTPHLGAASCALERAMPSQRCEIDKELAPIEQLRDVHVAGLVKVISSV